MEPGSGHNAGADGRRHVTPGKGIQNIVCVLPLCLRSRFRMPVRSQGMAYAAHTEADGREGSWNR